MALDDQFCALDYLRVGVTHGWSHLLLLFFPSVYRDSLAQVFVQFSADLFCLVGSFLSPPGSELGKHSLGAIVKSLSSGPVDQTSVGSGHKILW
jgi:hypothetical protein